MAIFDDASTAKGLGKVTNEKKYQKCIEYLLSVEKRIYLVANVSFLQISLSTPKIM